MDLYKTRKNQLRFYNEVLKGKTDWRRDGIDTLKFKTIRIIRAFGIESGKQVVNYITTEL